MSEKSGVFEQPLPESWQGGSAFPVLPPVGTADAGYPHPERGMTMRDYFAANAMQGMLSHQDFDYCPLRESSLGNVSRDAYRIADHMLEAREA